MLSLYMVLFSLPLSQSILNSQRFGKDIIPTHGEKATVERLRRSTQLANIGPAAARIVMKGAVKSKTQKKGYTIYVKKGSKTTAYREFMAALSDHENIMRYKTLLGNQAMLGQAGDRTIYYTPRDFHVGNKPTVTIYDPKRSWLGDSDNSSDKIVYELTILSDCSEVLRSNQHGCL